MSGGSGMMKRVRRAGLLACAPVVLATGPAVGAPQPDTPSSPGKERPAAPRPFSPPAGVFSHLLGYWTNGHFIWFVEQVSSGTIRANFFHADGKLATSYLMNVDPKNYNNATPVGDFGLFIWPSKDVLIYRTPDHFQFSNAKIEDGQPVYKKDHDKWNGIYRRLSESERLAWNNTVARRAASRGGGLLGVIEGAVAGAAGMVTGGGGYDAALAGAAAGAVAGAAGVDASSIQNGFTQGIAESNMRDAQMAAAAAAARTGGPSGATVAGARTVARMDGQAYLVVGMRPREGDTRNPMCYSTLFPISYDSEANGSGNAGRAEDAARALESRFLSGCARVGRVDGIVSPMTTANASFTQPRPHPSDYIVPLP